MQWNNFLIRLLAKESSPSTHPKLFLFLADLRLAATPSVEPCDWLDADVSELCDLMLSLSRDPRVSGRGFDLVEDFSTSSWSRSSYEAHQYFLSHSWDAWSLVHAGWKRILSHTCFSFFRAVPVISCSFAFIWSSSLLSLTLSASRTFILKQN